MTGSGVLSLHIGCDRSIPFQSLALASDGIGSAPERAWEDAYIRRR
jgi:hypothetical protein